jgi:hypothetical protein
MNRRLKPKTCTCGIEFLGGPTAKYCPNCRSERTRQHDRERHQRKLAGQIRHIGSTDLCTICGQPYTVNSGQQKYCESCSAAESKRRSHELWVAEYYGDPAKRQKYIQTASEWAEKHPDRVKSTLRKHYLNNADAIKNKRRKMYGVKLRTLGRTEACPKCKNEFVVQERNQKYCNECRLNSNKPLLTIT